MARRLADRYPQHALGDQIEDGQRYQAIEYDHVSTGLAAAAP